MQLGSALGAHAYERERESFTDSARFISGFAGHLQQGMNLPVHKRTKPKQSEPVAFYSRLL